jgi:hypothetical protein
MPNEGDSPKNWVAFYRLNFNYFRTIKDMAQ